MLCPAPLNYPAGQAPTHAMQLLKVFRILCHHHHGQKMDFTKPNRGFLTAHAPSWPLDPSLAASWPALQLVLTVALLGWSQAFVAACRERTGMSGIRLFRPKPKHKKAAVGPDPPVENVLSTASDCNLLKLGFNLLKQVRCQALNLLPLSYISWKIDRVIN